MNKKYLLTAVLCLSTYFMSAQKMVITFNSGMTQTIPTSTIKSIDFIDEDTPAPDPDPTPDPTTTGRILRSVGDYTFGYNSDGTLATIWEENVLAYNVTYSDGGKTMTCTLDYTYETENFFVQYICTLDNNKHITKMVMKMTETVSGSSVSDIDAEYDFQYDGNQHLVKMTGVATVYANGVLWQKKENGYSNLTWENGKLIKVEGGDDTTTLGQTGQETTFSEYTYNGVANKYGQNSEILEMTQFLEYLGYFGNMGDEFPSSIHNVNKNIEPYTSELENEDYTDNYTYDIDAEGYINSFTCTNSQYNSSTTTTYTYCSEYTNEAPSATRAKAATAKTAKSLKPTISRKSFLGIPTIVFE